MIARRRPCLLAPIALVFLLGACAEARFAAYTAKEFVTRTEAPRPHGAYKVGEPYQIDGVWYTPATDPNYDKVGIASWYGAKFHGRPTANGAVYDMNALTAAHKTLPLPSLVRVTNLENGRSLVLTLNDRGPFVRGRVIDVSRRASQLLGFYGKGTARVRVRAVSGDSGAPLVAGSSPRDAISQEPLPAVATARAATVEPIGRYDQAGAFTNPDNARRLSAELARFGPTRMIRAVVGGRAVYRVRLGPIATAEQANALLERVIRAGYSGARLVGN